MCDSWNNAYYKNAFPVIIVDFCDLRLFMFDLDRKLNAWLKFQPNFLTWLPYGKLEKTTVYLLISLLIQFSAIEISQVFPQAKFMTSWLQWLKKTLGYPCSLVSYTHFPTERAQYQGKSAMFSICACTRRERMLPCRRKSNFTVKCLDRRLSLTVIVASQDGYCLSPLIKEPFKPP